MDFIRLVGRDVGNYEKTSDLHAKQWDGCLAVKSVDTKKRQIRVLASSGDLDRHNERVLPEAFRKRLNIFKANPVILACHDHSHDDGSPPVVGKAEKTWIDASGLWAIIEFAETKLAEQYWQLYSGGFMRAVSIGFSPIAWRDEIEDGGRVRVFEEVELYEISLVAVPANRSALSKSKQKKLNWLAKKMSQAERQQGCDYEFGAALLGYKYIDGELVETDEFDFEGSKQIEAVPKLDWSGSLKKNLSDLGLSDAEINEALVLIECDKLGDLKIEPWMLNGGNNQLGSKEFVSAESVLVESDKDFASIVKSENEIDSDFVALVKA